MAREAQQKVTVQGKTLDARAAAAFAWADKRFRRKYPGVRLELAQGGFNKGGVAASAGTHDGAGVLDCRVVPLTAKQAKYALKCLKLAGFGAWARDHRDGMDPHIHAVMLCKTGTAYPNMPDIARDQAADYIAGRNGLASHAKDRNPWRPDPLRYFNFKAGKPKERG